MSKKLNMTNIGNNVIMSIGSMILMKMTDKSKFEVIRNGLNEPDVVTLVALEIP